MKKKSSQLGYSMVEIIVVIAIIGLLSTLAAISLKKVSNRAKDSKRISDISMIRRSLEIYKFTQGEYPSDAQMTNGYKLSTPLDNATLIISIPSNPYSNTGVCPPTVPRYDYRKDSGTGTYYINFCLDSKINTYGPGNCVATVKDTCETP